MAFKRVTAQLLAVLRAVLALDRDVYGLEISRHACVPQAATYLNLRRLTNEGYLMAWWEPDQPEGRPRRRYYRLVPERRGEAVDLLTKRGIDLPEVPW